MSIGFRQNSDGSWYSYKIEEKKQERDSSPASSSEQTKKAGRPKKVEEDNDE